MSKPWRYAILSLMTVAVCSVILVAQQAIKTEEVWITWTNLPPMFDIEYARQLGGATTQWIVYVKKVDGTMPMTNFQLHVVATNEARFWRLVPR